MRVSFVSFDAYPLLDPSVQRGIGGAEVRAVTFARGLRAPHGLDIEFIVREQDGLQAKASQFSIRPYDKPTIGPLRKLRYSLIKRWNHKPTPNSFFHQLDADIVLCFGVRNDTASFVRSVKESGKRCVVFLTSDRNLEDAARQGRRDRGIYGEMGHLCRYTLENADRVIAQTPYQLNALREQLGISGQLIRNPIDLSQTNHAVVESEKPTLLWVGRADTYSKRANLCIDLARRCPHYEFKMVMNNHDNETFLQLKAAAPSNVSILEHVAFGEIEKHFCGAKLLVNTSAAEGFPNSFLQAAKFGKPIVSLDVDSGNMLSQYGCGLCAGGNLGHMADVVDSLIMNRQFYDEVSSRAHHYVRTYHEASARCNELAQLLYQLVPSRAKPAA